MHYVTFIPTKHTNVHPTFSDRSSSTILARQVLHQMHSHKNIRLSLSIHSLLHSVHASWYLYTLTRINNQNATDVSHSPDLQYDPTIQSCTVHV